jgi:peptide/nickel transport system substrate-binding protein
MKKWFVFTMWLGILALVLSTAAIAQTIRLPQVPRQELLIVDNLAGRIANPTVFNPYRTGVVLHQGLHNLAIESLWDINTVTGEWVDVLAGGPPEPLNDDFTQWRIPLREGITWSDGVPFTSADVVFTFDMLRTNADIPQYAFWSGLVESAEADGDHAVTLTLTRPYAKLQTLLSVVVYGTYFRPVPKHIWEGVDVATFDNNPPVVTGPYVLESLDPNGYWFLWKLRDDWQNSTVGQAHGEPGPPYVLFVAYGTEERRILAGVQNQLDVFTDITPEGWEVLRSRNPNARAWHADFPYAWMDDPCERGMTFNLQREPYNLKEVRWALALATNIEEVSMATFSGMLRVSPLHIPPINVFKDPYFDALEPWLREFTLDDGYQPFDPDVATRIAAGFGNASVPTDEEGAKELFGIGWWKFDPEQAAKLLEDVGFSRGADGRWRLPDGSPWTMTIVAPSNFEIQSSRLAFAVADQWRNFGIDVNVQAVEAGQFWSMWPTGNYDVGSYWPGCGQIPDIWSYIDSFHQRNLKPTGEAASPNQIRWDNAEISRIAEELEVVLPTDPATIELGREALQIFVEEMPFIPMVGTSKFVPVVTTYWTNWPSADNHYDNPVWWWLGFKRILPFIEPTGQQ